MTSQFRPHPNMLKKITVIMLTLYPFCGMGFKVVRQTVKVFYEDSTLKNSDCKSMQLSLKQERNSCLIFYCGQRETKKHLLLQSSLNF